jgi:XTP/dITP diphosphohydrolase
VRKLVLATTNTGKLREIRDLLSGLPFELTTLAAYPPIAPPPETEATFAGNARVKAKHYGSATRELTVAEDSGLEIDALGGEPGVHSARFGGADASYEQKFRLIHDRLREADRPESPARFVCALALADGPLIRFEALGTLEGRISSEPRGQSGFGYDPIFFYPPFGCTLAEAGDAKSAVSHRAQAFRALRSFLDSAGLAR